MKENASGAYYKGKIETIEYMEYVAQCQADNGLPIYKVVDISLALKYLSSRLGAKDNVDTELEKAEQYIHHARTGKWLPSEKIKDYLEQTK